MHKCSSKCDTSELSLRDQVKATRDMIVTHGSEISTSAYYSSPRLSSEIPDCSLCLTFDHLSACLPAKTKVLMFDGRQKNIENMRKGDHILSYNIDKNRVETSEVTDIMKRSGVSSLIQLTTPVGTITLTPEHPVYIKGVGWVEAGSITEGMEILHW